MTVGRALVDWMSGVYAFYLLSYLAVLGLHYCVGSSLVVGAVCGLLIAVTSLVVKHRL